VTTPAEDRDLAERAARRGAAAAAALGLVAAAVAAFVVAWPSIKPSDPPATKAARLSHLTLDRDVTFGQYLDRKGFSRDPYQPSTLAQRGAFVAFDFRITGYDGKKLPLRWQLVDARTGDQLDQSKALSITPAANTDQGSWDVWVPLPRGRRRLYVQVQLYEDAGRVPIGARVPIGRLRTERFASPGPA
jgi:hypothetical protein